MSLSWNREGRDWPHRAYSHFVAAGNLHWHVQRMGSGPVALLIHGTGASTHSWRGLMPLLARRFTVVAMDLPAHAYTDTPPSAQLSLSGMATALAMLVEALALDVSLVVGHSAGAAIGARMVLDGALSPKALIAINGAFLPLTGLPGLIFPPVARLMAATPLAPWLFAQRSWDRTSIERLIGGTGSRLDEQGLALYAALASDPRHAAGALGMMARWDLRPLTHDLSRWTTPLTMITGQNDLAVDPQQAQQVRTLIPRDTPCTLERMAEVGHLAHEERPAEMAQRIFRCAQVEQGMPA